MDHEGAGDRQNNGQREFGSDLTKSSVLSAQGGHRTPRHGASGRNQKPTRSRHLAPSRSPTRRLAPRLWTRGGGLSPIAKRPPACDAESVQRAPRYSRCATMGNFAGVAKEARLKETSRSRLPGRAGEHHNFEVQTHRRHQRDASQGIKPNSPPRPAGMTSRGRKLGRKSHECVV
jgi:hypothetical protein